MQAVLYVQYVSNIRIPLTESESADAASLSGQTGSKTINHRDLSGLRIGMEVILWWPSAELEMLAWSGLVFSTGRWVINVFPRCVWVSAWVRHPGITASF